MQRTHSVRPNPNGCQKSQVTQSNNCPNKPTVTRKTVTGKLLNFCTKCDAQVGSVVGDGSIMDKNRCNARPKGVTGLNGCARPAFHKGQHSFLADLATARQTRASMWNQACSWDSNPRCESCLTDPQLGQDAFLVKADGYDPTLCIACNNES